MEIKKKKTKVISLPLPHHKTYGSETRRFLEFALNNILNAGVEITKVLCAFNNNLGKAYSFVRT